MKTQEEVEEYQKNHTVQETIDWLDIETQKDIEEALAKDPFRLKHVALMTEVNNIYALPSAVKKQQALIEINQKMKDFRREIAASPDLYEEQRADYLTQWEKASQDLALDVLGINLHQLVTLQPPQRSGNTQRQKP